MTAEEIGRIRAEFPMLRQRPGEKEFVYLDNGATSFKPECVLKAEESYYEDFDANTHRGDYDLAVKADRAYDEARKEVASFIGASFEETVFTSGATMGLNEAAYLLKGFIQPGDRIVIDKAEHASNVLPWFRLARDLSAEVVFAPLNELGSVTVEGLKSVLNDKTKIVSIAQVTNVLGSVNDVKALGAVAHNAGAFMVVDAAQSVPHMKVDFHDLDCDLAAFSGHKMYGPNGIGVLYGKKGLLERGEPLFLGGGMNARFYPEGTWTYEDLPFKFEAGTQNVPGALGLAAACRFLSSIGMEKIRAHESELKKRAVAGLENVAGISVYNPGTPSGILDFNADGIMAQDEGTLLNHKGICVRSGLHCAKILDSVPKTGTVRAVFGIYNTESEVDRLIAALKEGGDILDAYFA